MNLREGNWFGEVKKLLEQKGRSWQENRTGDGSIVWEGEKGSGLKLGLDKTLTCSFKVDLEELRMLISGDTTEDLSEDELCRVAREELRPQVDRLRRALTKAGFEEGIETDHDQYAIVFSKSVAEATPEEACELLNRCWQSLVSV